MLDLAIVGAGSMGANHARVAMGLRDARVTAIVDPDPVRGGKLAALVGAKYAENTSNLSDVASAAVVAVPTPLHWEIGTDLLQQGMGILVEKPISHDLETAAALVEAAEAAGQILMIGHIERFNPAIMELEHLIDRPIHVEAFRVSPFVPRIGDGVILDLMIHDLDIIRTFVDSPVVGIDAIATKSRSQTEDLAVALLQFENGVTATITASRIGQQKIRQMNVTQAENYVAVDLMRQDVTFHRVEEVSFTGAEGPGYRQRGVVEIPFLQHRGEPLYLELEHFVESVLSGSQPRVSGREGLEALRLATNVMEAAGLSR